MLSALENVVNAARSRDTRYRSASARWEMLEAVWIGRSPDHPAALSGGQQQRRCMRARLVNDLAIGDEPTATDSDRLTISSPCSDAQPATSPNPCITTHKPPMLVATPTASYECAMRLIVHDEPQHN